MSSPRASRGFLPTYGLFASPTSSSSNTSSAASSISSTSSTFSSWSMTSSSTSNCTSLTCAFPSWPSRQSLSPTMAAKDSRTSSSSPSRSPSSQASAYISDLDLLALDDEESLRGFLDEAPAPPRDLPLPPVAPMPLQPLFAQERPKKQRRRSSKKAKVLGKPMTPIAESP